MQERTSIRAALAGGMYFMLIFAIGFLLGAMRELFLLPWLGKTLAVVIELPIILGAAWVICSRLVTGFEVPATPRDRLIMGGVAFALLMVAEFCLAALVFGRGPLQHLLDYANPWALLGLAGQLLYAIFPLLQSRATHGSAHSSSIGTRPD